MIKSLIIEDEKLARDLIKDYLKEFSEIELAGEFEDGFSGLKAVNELKPDLVFLDIQMPKLSGFELLELLEHKPAIIFTTAYDQYAIKAFEHNAVDYLLKPFSRDRFREAISKATDRISKGDKDTVSRLVVHMDSVPEPIHRIVVKSGSRIDVIPIADVRYVEAQDDYVMIYTSGKKYLKQKTLKYFDIHLPRTDFIRVHRSYIVRISEIAQMELYEKDTYLIILKDGMKIPVSKTGLPGLREVLDF
jgi:two-component system LytT family response regulator